MKRILLVPVLLVAGFMPSAGADRATAPQPDYASPPASLVQKIENLRTMPKRPTEDPLIIAQDQRASAQIKAAVEAKALQDAQEAAQRILDAQMTNLPSSVPERVTELVDSSQSPPVSGVSPECMAWMEQAGIADTTNAGWIIERESGCNPNAVNAGSGACGMGQQLPCGKWPHTWNDPVGAMIDMQDYAIGRYGSWANAVAFWQAHSWY